MARSVSMLVAVSFLTSAANAQTVDSSPPSHAPASQHAAPARTASAAPPPTDLAPGAGLRSSAGLGVNEHLSAAVRVGVDGEVWVTRGFALGARVAFGHGFAGSNGVAHQEILAEPTVRLGLSSGSVTLLWSLGIGVAANVPGVDRAWPRPALAPSVSFGPSAQFRLGRLGVSLGVQGEAIATTAAAVTGVVGVGVATPRDPGSSRASAAAVERDASAPPQGTVRLVVAGGASSPSMAGRLGVEGERWVSRHVGVGGRVMAASDSSLFSSSGYSYLVAEPAVRVGIPAQGAMLYWSAGLGVAATLATSSPTARWNPWPVAPTASVESGVLLHARWFAFSASVRGEAVAPGAVAATVNLGVGVAVPGTSASL